MLLLHLVLCNGAPCSTLICYNNDSMWWWQISSWSNLVVMPAICLLDIINGSSGVEAITAKWHEDCLGTFILIFCLHSTGHTANMSLYSILYYHSWSWYSHGQVRKLHCQLSVKLIVNPQSCQTLKTNLKLPWLQFHEICNFPHPLEIQCQPSWKYNSDKETKTKWYGQLNYR